MAHRHTLATAIDPRRTARRAATLFACLAATWVVGSALLVALLVPAARHPAAQTTKGLAFVVLATPAFYLVLHRALRRAADASRELAEAQAQALRDQTELLRAFTARQLAIRDEERGTLARTVHDVLGQHVLVLRLMLGRMRRQAPADRPLCELIDEAERTAGELASAVRGLSGALRPPVADGERLCEALERLAQRFAGHGGPVIDVRASDIDVELTIATQLHRIAQEAIVNAVRHAHAGQMRVTLTRTPTRLRLSVADDGRGVAPGAAPGVGTTSMTERARLAGGTLELLDPGALGGVEVVAEVPLGEAAS
jgi:signal transduction histidine kinase